jgi:hypothetical protein
VATRTIQALRTSVARAPVTTGYVALLVLTHLYFYQLMSANTSHRLLLAMSTNLDNLGHRPVRVLLASALFVDGTFTDVMSLASTVITFGIGVGCCLTWLEGRWGAPRAYAVFLAGHVGATLLTAVVIGVALAHGWYPPSVTGAVDVGISYGAEAVLAAVTPFLPLWTRLPWVVFVATWPVVGADWQGPLPDFTTVGHLVAAMIGFAIAAGLTVRRRRRGALAGPGTGR